MGLRDKKRGRKNKLVDSEEKKFVYTIKNRRGA